MPAVSSASIAGNGHCARTRLFLAPMDKKNKNKNRSRNHIVTTNISCRYQNRGKKNKKKKEKERRCSVYSREIRNVGLGNIVSGQLEAIT